MDPATDAMEKLLRTFVVFDEPMVDYSIKAEEDKIADLSAKPDRLPGLLETIQTRLDLYNRIKGAEVWALTYREEWPIKADVRQASKVAEQGGYDPDVRQAFVNEVQWRAHAKACLRVPGKKGRVALLTDREAADMDSNVAVAVFNAYYAAFVLTEAETPKVPAPPSTPA